MKIKGLLFIASLAIVISACSQGNVENIKLENKEDSLAYAIGINTFQGITGAGLDIDPLILAKGMLDAKNGELLMNEVAAEGFITIYMREKQEEEMKANFGENIEAGEKFLKENSARAGVLVTASGLQYEVVVKGDGPMPTETDRVRVHYTGSLIDGTVFDSSVEKGTPYETNVNGVIRGWVEGLQLMPVGSKFNFYIPYDLGYGARGSGAAIQPFSTLVFEVELLDIITE